MFRTVATIFQLRRKPRKSENLTPSPDTVEMSFKFIIFRGPVSGSFVTGLSKPIAYSYFMIW
jgi:hypothetical protein